VSGLAVRLKLRIRTTEGRAVEAIALLNSGFEAPTPQLIVPIDVAKELGLWPPEGAVEVELETVGGPVRAWFYPRRAFVKVVASDAESKEVLTDVIVAPTVNEPLISDMLADELEIAVEAFGRGLWRFRWEQRPRSGWR
jgi:hypothetical protein